MCVGKALLHVSFGGRWLANSLFTLFSVGCLIKPVELLHVAHACEVENFECSG